MKVTLITGEYPPMRGGVADYTSLLARGLRQLGVEVAVLTAKRAASANSPTDAAIHPLVESWGFGVSDIVAEHVRRVRPNVLHLQYQTGAFDMRLGVNFLPWANRIRGGQPPFVVTFHDLREPYILPKLGPARHLATMLLAAGADAVVATNSEDLARVSNASGKRTRMAWGNCRLAAIPIGSNIPATATGPEPGQIRRRIGAGRDDPIVTYFGFIGPAKGVDDLVEAFRLLVDRGRPVRLLMVGATASDTGLANRVYENAIRRRLDHPLLRGRVTWTGFLSSADVGSYLDAADVCCLPFRDGVSLRHGTLIAAITRGLPIVTTSRPHPTPVAGLPPLTSEENVLLVPPADPTALADGIERVLVDGELRQKMRRGALALESSFDWHTIARQTLRLYEELVE